MSDAPQVTPGQPMSAEQKQQMAKFNEEETNRAHELAAQRRGEEGNEPPLVNVLSESIKEKLKALPPEEGAPETPAS